MWYDLRADTLAVFDAADNGDVEGVEKAAARFLTTRRLSLRRSWLLLREPRDPAALLKEAEDRYNRAKFMLHGIEPAPQGFDPLTILAVLGLIVNLIRLWMEWKKRPRPE